MELKRLLRYIETKRQDAKEEINVTHVTMKACAVRVYMGVLACLFVFERLSERIEGYRINRFCASFHFLAVPVLL